LSSRASQCATAILGAVLGALSGCLAPERAVGIQQVDGLVSKVERVHLDAELGQQQAHGAVDALRALVMDDFDGGAADGFTRLLQAVERSEIQAQRLRADRAPMDQAALTVFEQWTLDLEAFASENLRLRSAQRRDQTVQRYAEVVASIGPAVEGLEAFNVLLRDHALYLSNDLNESSVSELEPELEILRGHLEVLDARLQACADAARDYVRHAAPLGQVSVREVDAGAARR
jgi:hypothetical protein